MRTNLKTSCLILVVACLILGGGTSPGFLSDIALQLLAIPILLIGVWTLLDHVPEKPVSWALLFCLALVMLPLLQVIPLPSAIWANLGDRNAVAEALQQAGLGQEGTALPWLPLSLDPRSTWLSLLALIPPLAVFLITLQLGYRARRQMSLTIVAFGLISVLIGLLQIAQGQDSPLRFFEFTNTSEAVGFFANRNHFAALLYSVIVLTAAWLIVKLAMPEDANGLSRRGRFDPARLLWPIGGFTAIVALIGGQLTAASRAGVGLTIVALIGVFLMSLSVKAPAAIRSSTAQPGTAHTGRTQKSGGSLKVLWAGVALAVIFATQFALFRILDRLGATVAEDLRVTMAKVAPIAAMSHMPFGSGIGSFVPAYKQFEQAGDIHGGYYANHAHNDYLQVWLEAGVLGMVLGGVFLLWFIWRSYQVWRRSLPDAQPIDDLLARGASIVILLILLHSIVDYPLRTAAMMAIFAFSVALLFAPPAAVRELEAVMRPAEPLPPQRRQRKTARPAQSFPGAASAPAEPFSWPSQTPSQTPSEASSGSASQDGGASWQNSEWPEEWQVPGGNKRPQKDS